MAAGLVLGIFLGGYVLVPSLFRLVSETVQATAKGIKYPTGTNTWAPFTPGPAENLYGDITQEEGEGPIPSWMEEAEEEVG